MEEKFRISDIFKKSKDGGKLPVHKRQDFQPKTEEINKQGQQPKDKVSFSSVIGKALERRQDVSSSMLYAEAVSLAQKIYKNPSTEQNIATEVYSLVKRMVDLATREEDSKELLKSALADYPQPEDYLYYHVANVCILCLYLSQGLAYERPLMIELGIAAFLHDIGISKYLDIINQPKRLSLQEYNEIKRHPIIGPQILDKSGNNLDATVFEVMRQEHERIDGSGYPRGLKEDKIIEYAQIVGLSDFYEAMTHTRPHRDKHASLEAIKEILSNKHTFAHRLVKILIEEVGIFPTGVIVQLNTKEIGQVISQNPGLPLRPVVNIMFDSLGKRLKLARQIDLSGSPTVYILGPSSEPK